MLDENFCMVRLFFWTRLNLLRGGSQLILQAIPEFISSFYSFNMLQNSSLLLRKK